MSEYIEKGKLIDYVQDTYGGGNEDNTCIWYGDVIEMIRSEPAAGVAEVRYGKWITPHWRNSTSCANCSECGFEAQHSDYRGVQEYYKLCPSCGAKMDEMEEEK